MTSLSAPTTPAVHVQPVQGIRAWLFGVTLAIGAVLLFWLLSGEHPLEFDSAWTIVAVLALMFASIPVHELVHVAAHLTAGGLNRSEVDLRFRVVAARAPERLSAFRLVLGAPCVVFGLAALAGGLLVEEGLSGPLFAATVAGSFSDLLTLRALRGLPGNSIVQDRPVGEVGCDVWVAVEEPERAGDNHGGARDT